MLTQYIAENYTCCLNGLTTVADFVGSFRQWSAAHGQRRPQRSDIVEAIQAAGFQIARHNGQLTILGLEVATPKYRIDAGRIVRALA